MYYTVEGQLVYKHYQIKTRKQTATIKEWYGYYTYTMETESEIITYQFETVSGEYVEISREPLPDEPTA